MKKSYVLALLPALASAAVIQPRQFKLIPLANDTIKGCDIQNYATEIDDCETLAHKGILTLAEFITYNPSVGLDCSKLHISQPYCIHATPAPDPSTLLKPLPPKPKSAPGKTFGAAKNCQQWQKIFPDDVKDKKETCDGLARMWGSLDLEKAQAREWLQKLNTGLTPDCSNIEVNSWLCVRVPLQTTKVVVG